MKLVVEIPDLMIDWLKNGYPNEDDMDKLLDIVFNATPLEKVLEDIKEEIKRLKRDQNSENTDYRTGFFSALSIIEGYIAIIEEHISGKGIE